VDGWGPTREASVESLLVEVAKLDSPVSAEFDRPPTAETDI
jgi:hypothetical protein